MYFSKSLDLSRRFDNTRELCNFSGMSELGSPVPAEALVIADETSRRCANAAICANFIFFSHFWFFHSVRRSLPNPCQKSMMESVSEPRSDEAAVTSEDTKQRTDTQIQPCDTTLAINGAINQVPEALRSLRVGSLTSRESTTGATSAQSSLRVNFPHPDFVILPGKLPGKLSKSEEVDYSESSRSTYGDLLQKVR